jgi:hypothetical protein
MIVQSVDKQQRCRFLKYSAAAYTVNNSTAVCYCAAYN